MDPTRLRGIILALALTLALGGCSAIKLGYNALPNIAYLWLDGYVDFSDTQAPRAREELSRLHAWHRQEELPRLVQVLAGLEQLAAGEFTAPQACGIVAQVRERMNAVAARAEAGAVALAGTLTGRELRHMQRKFRRSNERFQEEWVALPPAERHEKRFRLQLDRAETIYGRLDEPQRAALRQRIEQSAWEPARSLREIERRQQELLQVLRAISHGSHVPEAEARAQLRGWLGHIEKAPDPAYRGYQDALLQEGCTTFATLHASTTPHQRDQAVRRLRAYQRDLRDLMAQQP